MSRLPSIVSVALGLGSLTLGIALKIVDGRPPEQIPATSPAWIIWISGFLAAQIGLVFAASAGLHAPRGSGWRTLLPGFAASMAALAFWALSG